MDSYWEAWNADVERDPDEHLAEEFRDRMQVAVACRLRAPKRPGVMMSGGLDSTVIAGLARRHLDRTGRPGADLHSYSLVVDGAEGFEDELERIEATVEAFDLESHTVRVNDHYVLRDVEAYERASWDVETGIDSVAMDQQYKRFFRRARRFEDAAQRRVALRAGVEFRLPYLDTRLISFAMSLPPGSLMAAGEDKVLFQRATEGLLPESVRTQSAAVTFDAIVRRGLYDERREYVEDVFADSELVRRAIADADAFEDHVTEPFDPEGGQRPIWELLATELWLRQWGRVQLFRAGPGAENE